MKLYAQHGWGKGDKVDSGLQAGHIEGVILSPHDEEPNELAAFVNRLAGFSPRPDVMTDPQVFVSLLPDANEGKLPMYAYYESGLALRDFTSRRIQSVVRQVIDFQRHLSVTHILTPTVIQDGFTDRTAQVAHSLAQESADYWNSFADDRRPLLVSLVFAEDALSSHDQVAELLDTASLYEAEGFYIVVDRNSTLYSQDFNPTRLAEFLTMIYSLSRSRFQIVLGYSDFVALLYAGMGADAAATGWSQKLRLFNRSRFLPSRGGRQPRDRYSSSPLLNSIYMTELDACQDAGRLRAVLSNTPYDRVFDGRSYPSGVSWSPDTNVLHHWATLSRLPSRMPSAGIRERCQYLSHALTQAQAVYRDVSGRGVAFEAPNGAGHLSSWTEALATFRSAFRI